jgi:serine/threonine-protein kinase HipA
LTTKALLYDQVGQYIAKFNRKNQDVYNNARVELACLNMARAAGLNVGQGRVIDGINDREVLLLERFDIAADGSRHHLITVNGLLKEPLSQRDIGNVFRYDDICTLLRQYSVTIEHDLQQLLRVMIFNRAINNTDDHERNFSFIHRNDGYQLAPAYDLVPSLAAGEYHAAGFAYQPYPPTPSEAIKLGKIFGLSKRCVANVAEQVMDVLSSWRSFAEDAGVHEKDSAAVQRCIRF